MTDQILTLVFASGRTNKPVGRIFKREDRAIVLEKSLRTRHILRQPPAICYDVSIIEQAKAFGVTTLLVRNVETGCTYTIPFDLFLEKSFKVNRGFGEQRGCCLSDWESTYPHINICRYSPSRDAEPKPILPQKPAIIQPSLFDSITEKITLEKDSLFGSRTRIQPESFRVASLIS